MNVYNIYVCVKQQSSYGLNWSQIQLSLVQICSGKTYQKVDSVSVFSLDSGSEGFWHILVVKRTHAPEQILTVSVVWENEAKSRSDSEFKTDIFVSVFILYTCKEFEYSVRLSK